MESKHAITVSDEAVAAALAVTPDSPPAHGESSTGALAPDMGLNLRHVGGARVMEADADPKTIVVAVGGVEMRLSSALAAGIVVKTADGKYAFAEKKADATTEKAPVAELDFPFASQADALTSALGNALGEQGAISFALQTVMGNAAPSLTRDTAAKLGMSDADLQSSIRHGVSHITTALCKQLGVEAEPFLSWASEQGYSGQVTTRLLYALGGMPVLDYFKPLAAKYSESRVRSEANAPIPDSVKVVRNNVVGVRVRGEDGVERIISPALARSRGII